MKSPVIEGAHRIRVGRLRIFSAKGLDSITATSGNCGNEGDSDHFRPAGARIEVNDNYVGDAPISITVPSEGDNFTKGTGPKLSTDVVAWWRNNSAVAMGR